MEIINITECRKKKQGQEVRTYEPFKEVLAFVNQAQLAACGMDCALDEIERERRSIPAPELSKIVEGGLKALEGADNAETALWKAREELSILQLLLSPITAENLDLFERAFSVIKTLMQTASEYKAAVRNILTSPGAAEENIETARTKIKFLKIELPNILAATDQIEM